VFQLGIWNDLGIYSKWYAFGVNRSKVKVTEWISPICILEPQFTDIRSRLWLSGCLVRALLTFARWDNQLSAWDCFLWVLSSSFCPTTIQTHFLLHCNLSIYLPLDHPTPNLCYWLTVCVSLLPETIKNLQQHLSQLIHWRINVTDRHKTTS